MGQIAAQRGVGLLLLRHLRGKRLFLRLCVADLGVDLHHFKAHNTDQKKQHHQHDATLFPGFSLVFHRCAASFLRHFLPNEGTRP